MREESRRINGKREAGWWPARPWLCWRREDGMKVRSFHESGENGRGDGALTESPNGIKRTLSLEDVAEVGKRFVETCKVAEARPYVSELEA
jgi:hypothetical protein